jgi:tetratricopeptide (TPR) repeat protein
VLRITLIVLMIFGALSASRADVVYQRSGASELPIKDVKITGISGTNLNFTSRGAQASRPLEAIIRLEVDGEPVFNQAEQAFAARKYDAAVDGYDKAIRSTARPWLKDWIGPRLVESAAQTGRFDAAVSGYISLLMSNPSAAARYKPPLPDGRSTFIDTAIKDVNAALSQKLSEEQRLAMLNFLLELQRAKGDPSAVEQTLQQLIALTGPSGESEIAQQALAQAKLSSAKVALDANDFNKALTEIESNRGVFGEPQQQAEALYCVGMARLGMARQNNDPAQAKDAGLAFMRVVAHFRETPGQPRVPESLLGAASSHELLGEKETALRLYEQVANSYRDTPHASTAQDRVAQLRAQ